jgi:hypothetical protein
MRRGAYARLKEAVEIFFDEFCHWFSLLARQGYQVPLLPFVHKRFIFLEHVVGVSLDKIPKRSLEAFFGVLELRKEGLCFEGGI